MRGVRQRSDSGGSRGPGRRPTRRRGDDIRMCIDQFVPDEQRGEAMEAALAARPDNLRMEPLPQGPNPSRMAVVVASLWPPESEITVRFMDGDPGVQRKVEERAHEWSDHANIRFAFGDDPNAQIRISFQREGSWSYLGTVALQIPKADPTMNFGWLTPDSADTEYSRVVLHEFGHALGAFHEHQNPDVEIPWDREAVYAHYARHGWSRLQVDRNLLEAYSPAGVRNSRFDAQSIMLYAVDNALTIGDWEVGWNAELSAMDKEFIATQYPREPRTVSAIDIGGPASLGSIGAHGEIDTYSFTVDTPGRHIIATGGPTDVALGLFGPDSDETLRAFDNDSGRGTNARVVRRLEPGRYLVRVQHFHPTGTGDYELSVRRAAS